MPLIFNQTHSSMGKILDSLVDNLALSQTKQRALIKERLCPHKEKYFTTAEICKEILNAFLDYHLLRDTFLSTYAREVRQDHQGNLDDRKFQLTVVKIAKREGLSHMFNYAQHYSSTRVLIISVFAQIEFERKENKALSSFEKGMAYEKQVVAALINNGLSAELTGSGPDFGADLTFKFMNKLFVGQCKALSKACGVKAVQETVSAISHYKADYGVVFSQLGFSDPAIKLAESNQVVLVTGLDIKSMMRQIVILE